MTMIRALLLCLAWLATASHAQLLSSTPAQQAQDADAFASIGPLLADRLADIQSVVVVLRGRTVYEFYRDGKPEALRNVQSVEKSAISTLFGMALAQGHITSIDQPVLELVPEWRALNEDPRAAAITVRHLLTMTAGFAVNDPGGNTGRSVAPAKAWARPMAAAPGERFAYDNSGIAVLVGVLEKATGMRAQDYARQQMVAPLEMAEPSYERALHLRTVDMAKLGQLFLQEGAWNGKQLLSAAYVQASTHAQNKGGPPVSLPYGQLWWVVSPATYMASGYAGQMIWVHRPTQAVVAITSTVSQESQQRGHAVQLVRNALFAAIERRLKMEAR